MGMGIGAWPTNTQLGYLAQKYLAAQQGSGGGGLGAPGYMNMQMVPHELWQPQPLVRPPVVAPEMPAPGGMPNISGQMMGAVTGGWGAPGGQTAAAPWNGSIYKRLMDHIRQALANRPAAGGDQPTTGGIPMWGNY